MTVLERPPAASDGRLTESAEVPGRRSPLAGWRLALRLARRDVRRRPGRTLLVTALIAAPIAAMALSLVIAGTAPDTAQESFQRRAGQADMVIGTRGDGAAVIEGLPGGSRAITSRSIQTAMTAADGSTVPWAEFRVVPFDDPLAEGLVEVVDGRLPIAADEVIIGQDVATAFGVGIGDALELDRPSGSWEVVGIGSSRVCCEETLFGVTSFDANRLQPDYDYSTVLVDLPDGLSQSELEAISRSNADDGTYAETAPRLVAAGLEQRAEDRNLPVEAMAWGWVAGAVALAAVGVIIAAAFATSARRQLATIGQLSANGASERLVRRTLGLEGAWTGLIGSGVGIGIALVVLPFTRPIIEHIVDRDIGPWVVEWWAIGVILVTGVLAATVAALVPARSAARIPVLAALAGRRPLAAAPRRLIPIGVGLFLGGVALLVLVTVASTSDTSGRNGNLYAVVAVLGGLAVMAGMCCASPIAVDLIGRVGGRLGGTWRLAVRSVVRSRTRSAGVLTAIAITGTAAIAITTAVGSLAFSDDGDTAAYLPTDTAVISAIRYEQAPGWTVDEPVSSIAAVPISPDIERRFAEILPEATVGPRTVAAASTFDARSGTGYLLLADATTLDLLGLSARDRDALDEVGLLMTSSTGETGGQPETTSRLITTSEGSAMVEVAVARDPLRSRAGSWDVVVTPERAEELGLHTVDVGLVAINPEPLSRDQRDALSELTNELWNSTGRQPDAFVEPGDPVTASSDSTDESWVDSMVAFGSDASSFPRELVDAIAVSAALVLTLLVVAIGLALAATDSRDERDVLVAVGGKPRTLRGLAGTKAVVLTVGAAILAIPTGFIPVAAIITAASEDNAVTFPWLTALGLLVVIPVIAGLAALATSALAQRFRPVTMSTLAFD